MELKASGLAAGRFRWQNRGMTTTLTIDEAGRIELSDDLRRIFHAQPGTPFRAEVTEGRIEILKDASEPDDEIEITALEMVDGVLILPKTGAPFYAAAAVREERDALAMRGLPR